MNLKLNSLVAATLTGWLMMGFGTNAMADKADSIVNALVKKGLLTEEEGALLLKESVDEKEVSDKKKEAVVSAKFKDGLSFESGDGKFKAQINGRLHADYRIFNHNDNSNNTPPAGAGNSIANTNSVTDTFDIRRARLGFKTTFKEYYSAEVVGDFSSSARLDVGYLNIAWWKPVQFRFGQFKMPMGLEQQMSSNNIDFMERSFTDQLAPAKEIGVMVHGTPFTGVTYALAFSNGVNSAGQNATEGDIREDGKDVIGRVTANFAEIMGNKDMVLHAGLAYSQGDLPQGKAGVDGRTEARGATFFTAPTLANTPFKSIDRSRIGVEGAAAYGPFKAQAEWLRANNDFKTNTRSYNLDVNNWYAEALWTITGESYADGYKNGAFGSIKPKADFNPTNFSGGAWVVGLRYSEFDASDYDTAGIGQGNGTDANITTKAKGFAKANAWTAGVKFLPTANIRLMLDYVDTTFNDVIGEAAGGVIINNKRVDDEKAVIMRAQWMF
ncbi:MAG: porin [Methylotenera sp.]|nr:porin [Methylotenera sp.]